MLCFLSTAIFTSSSAHTIRPNSLHAPDGPQFFITHCLGHRGMPSKTTSPLFCLVNFHAFPTSPLKSPKCALPSLLCCRSPYPSYDTSHRLLKLLVCWFCLLKVRDYGFFTLAFPAPQIVPGTLETQKTMFVCFLIKAVLRAVTSRREY